MVDTTVHQQPKGEIQNFNASLVDGLVADTHATFSFFKNTSPLNRSKVLSRTAELISSRREEIARLITSEVDKPITHSRIEVDRAAFTFSASAKAALKADDDIYPELYGAPNAVGKKVSYRYFPLGVIAAITPFNFPLNLVAHKVAPAIAVGNCVILKPAPQAPRTALLLAAIMTEAGLPSGVLNVVNCTNEIAETMIMDERIKMLSFTGSAEVGWKLKSLVPKKKVTLELGGNGSCIVDEVQDWDKLVNDIISSAFGYAGQICISLQNLYVSENLYLELLGRVVSVAKNLKVADVQSDETILSPMISEEAATKVEKWIQLAIDSGGKRHCGELIPPRNLSATVLTDVPENSPIRSEEAFAPIVNIIPYKEINDALTSINLGKYGLQISLYSTNEATIDSAYKQLEVGGLIINNSNALRIDTMPYGGVKNSGFGREGIEFAIREMSEIKVKFRPE